MAGIRFEFSLNSDPVIRTLWRMAGSLDDLTPLMNDIGQALVNSGTERITSTNTDPDGHAWEPSKRVKEHGGKTLHLTGVLGYTLTHQAAADHVVVGSNLVYAAVMHEGAEQGAFGAAIGRTQPSEKRPRSQDYFTPLPWGDIPARPFLGVSDRDEEEILDRTKAFFASVVNGLA